MSFLYDNFNKKNFFLKLSYKYSFVKFDTFSRRNSTNNNNNNNNNVIIIIIIIENIICIFSLERSLTPFAM